MGEKISRLNKHKKLYFIIASLVVVIISASLAFIISMKISVDKWNDKIYTGVTVEGVDLGSNTRDEAINIISEKFQQAIGNKKININVGEKLYTYNYSDLSANYDIEKAIDEALSYGKDSGILDKNSFIKKGVSHSINLDFSYDEEKVQNIKTAIEDSERVIPVDSKINISNGNIQVTPSHLGYEANMENFEENLKGVLNGKIDSESNIVVELREVEANITTEELSRIKNLMSTFSTTYTVGDRGKNIEIAASLVNKTVLMPGDMFSYSEVSQKGIGQYLYANGYINGKVEAVEAGGICQVSSTLYRAIMRANIESVERHNHMMPVSYAPLGLDATVAWGSLDYRFRNTYDFPIYIEAIAYNGVLNVNVYGDKQGLNGYTYDIVNKDLGVNNKGNHMAESFKVTYLNGAEVDRKYIAKDEYLPYK